MFELPDCESAGKKANIKKHWLISPIEISEGLSCFFISRKKLTHYRSLLHFIPKLPGIFEQLLQNTKKVWNKMKQWPAIG